MLGIIGGNFLLFFSFFEVLYGDASMITNRHAKLLANFLDVLHQLLAPLLGELRNRHSDNLTVVVRGESQVRLENRFFDISHGTAVVGLYHQQTRLRRTQA